MTNEEILKAIRACARKLHRNPNLRDLRAMAGVPAKAIYKCLGGLSQALQAAGLEGIGPGFSPAEDTILRDWATVARKLKKLPSVLEYERTGRFSYKPFQRRYGTWARVPGAFRKFAQGKAAKREWRDVLKTIAAATTTASGTTGLATALGSRYSNHVTAPKDGKKSEARAARRLHQGGLLLDRPVYGRPLQLPELAHEPVNELGVLFVFGTVARRLGLVVHHLQARFPDCIAMRETARGKWQRVRIEFEFESRNFLKHRHRVDRCDVIVCWKHNWPGCPLQVIELKSVVEKQLATGK